MKKFSEAARKLGFWGAMGLDGKPLVYGMDYCLRWEYDNYSLIYRPKYYDVDLLTIVNCGELCDWIFQIAQKNWADPEVLADFVQSLDWILEPQYNYCSGGKVLKNVEPKNIIDGFFERHPK